MRGPRTPHRLDVPPAGVAPVGMDDLRPNGPSDPFQKLDVEGVGALVRIGVEKGRSVKADLKVGICGEHGGEPSSVGFCHAAGFNYVSCSPFRVPIAILAAAQAVLRAKR